LPLLLAALASLGAAPSGCVTSNPAGTPPLAVTLPTACELVLKAPALPAVAPTDDARAAFVKDDAALIKARGTIARGRACLAEERALYAAPGKR
jgi:hypothetical protein